jgi:hypothetical protein
MAMTGKVRSAPYPLLRFLFRVGYPDHPAGCHGPVRYVLPSPGRATRHCPSRLREAELGAPTPLHDRVGFHSEKARNFDRTYWFHKSVFSDHPRSVRASRMTVNAVRTCGVIDLPGLLKNRTDFDVKGGDGHAARRRGPGRFCPSFCPSTRRIRMDKRIRDGTEKCSYQVQLDSGVVARRTEALSQGGDTGSNPVGAAKWA